MPIVSQKVVAYKVGAGWMASINYLFSDGRKLRKPPIFCKGQLDAEQKATKFQAEINKKVVLRDAGKAVRNGVLTAVKDATLIQVQFAWMQAGVKAAIDKDPYVAFNYLKHHVQSMIDSGFKNSDLAIRFDTDEKTIQKIKDTWLKLKDAESTLMLHKAIQEGIK